MTRMKLLMIMHDDVLAKAYRARLAKLDDLEVDRRATAHDGLARARQWTPDLILLDLALPGLHGLDVLKMLRDVPWLVTVHVVLLIERTLSPEILDECLLWGADSYLQKDTCSIDAVVAHLRTVLQSIAARTAKAAPPATR